jgi:hypothetical protein
MLTIWTDQGRLILTGSVGIFIRNEGQAEVTHQLDFNVGFNIAPDYCGAGFTTELNDLKETACSGQPAPMNLEEVVRLERLIFKAYEVSHEVETFTDDFVVSTPYHPRRLGSLAPMGQMQSRNAPYDMCSICVISRLQMPAHSSAAPQANVPGMSTYSHQPRRKDSLLAGTLGSDFGLRYLTFLTSRDSCRPGATVKSSLSWVLEASLRPPGQPHHCWRGNGPRPSGSLRWVCWRRNYMLCRLNFKERCCCTAI